MTVQEYREKFEELSVYKESFRTHPKDKMSKFIDGLKWSYQTHLSVQEHASYKALVEAALRLDSRARFVEPLRRNHQTTEQVQKRSHDSHITNDNSQAQSSIGYKRFRPNEHRQQRSSLSVPSLKDAGCFYCREQGHKKVDCPKLLRDSELRGADHGNSGGNTYVGGNRSFQVQGRGNANQPAQSQISHNKAQASSQPGRVYALTNDDHVPNTLEGNFDFIIA
jgi:hypothetical protein